LIHFIGPQALLCCQNHATIQELLNWLQDKEVVAVDTETEGLFNFSNKVIMLQIGNETDQFVIDTRTTDVSLLAPFFADPTKLKVFWNAKFDIKFLRFTFNFDVANVYDGFLAECVLNTGREDVGLSLDAASVKYLNKKLNKQVRNKFVGLTGTPYNDMQVTYGAEDVEVLLSIRDYQLALIKKERLENVVKLENAAVLTIADIEYNGMLMCADSWKEVAALTTVNVEEQVRVLDDLVINNPKLSRFVPQGTQTNLFGFEERRLHINWSSPKQKLAILSALLNMPIDSSSTPFLMKYRNMPIIAAMLEYSKQKKLSDSFGYDFLKYINPQTKRIHQDIWQVLDTGRMSSSDP
jgi:DNA polymerase I-like protein with 3'-5' exonuclease and polymerase domains